MAWPRVITWVNKLSQFAQIRLTVFTRTKNWGRVCMTAVKKERTRQRKNVGGRRRGDKKIGEILETEKMRDG